MSTPSSSTPQQTSSQQAQSAAATPQFVAYPLAAGQQPQLPAQASTSNESRTQPQTRLPSAETRKDRSLVDFLLMLDDYEPLVCVYSFSGSAFSLSVRHRSRTKLPIITCNVSVSTVRTLACEFEFFCYTSRLHRHTSDLATNAQETSPRSRGTKVCL